MNKYHITLLLCLLGGLLSFSPLQAQHVYTLGPMLHYNFGGASKGHFSGGLEAAYWHVYDFPFGMDVGIDFEKGRWRVYTEAQTGLFFGGISAGPFLEMPKGAPARLGLQTSIWANAFVGVDIRARFSRGETRFAPGIYVKGFWTADGDFLEEWEEHHENDGEGGGGWDWD